jgi:hypothetical protein
MPFEQPGVANRRERFQSLDTSRDIEQRKRMGTYVPHPAFGLENLIEEARERRRFEQHQTKTSAVPV